MTFSPGPRKLALVAHVTTSVGWLGAAVAFLALAAAGVDTDDPARAHAVYVAADVVARRAIVPLALMAVATGILQGLVTTWGLFRHYWVVIKLVISVVAAGVLLQELAPIADLAELAATGALTSTAEARGQRMSLVLHSGLGSALLLVPVALSIYKPTGRTRYGRRYSDEAAAARSRTRAM